MAKRLDRKKIVKTIHETDSLVIGELWDNKIDHGDMPKRDRAFVVCMKGNTSLRRAIDQLASSALKNLVNQHGKNSQTL